MLLLLVTPSLWELDAPVAPPDELPGAAVDPPPPLLPASSHLCMCSRTLTGRLHRIFSISFMQAGVSFGTN